MPMSVHQAFDHRREQVDQALAPAARSLVGMTARGVQGGRRVVGEGARRLGLRLHRQQHALHVRMMDDRDRVGIGPAEPSALDPFEGITAGLLKGAIRDSDPFQPDRHARVVHHREHQIEAAILFADQKADGTSVVAERHHRRRARIDAQLVLDGDAAEIVARPEPAVLLRQELRHQEQRQAPHAIGRARRAGENGVDDVGREVVLAVGDENFLAGDAKVVSIRHRLGSHARQIGTGLRLGQQHRPGPLAGNQLRQVGGPHARIAVTQEKLGRRPGQQRADRECHVGGAPDLADGGRQQAGQTLPSVVGRKGQAVPAALDESPVGVDEAVRHAHGTILENAPLPVAGGVQRRQHLGAEAPRLFEHGVHQVVGRLFVARQFADRPEISDLPHGKSDVGERRGIGCHGDGTLREGGDVSHRAKPLIVHRTRAPDIMSGRSGIFQTEGVRGAAGKLRR